jgi:predicted HAD superfamily Cof-like phosphohydrolase
MMQDIIDFHKKFGLDYDGPPRELPMVLAGFRVACMREEVKEYLVADTHFDRLDAIIDLVYFALGTVYLHGYAPVFDEAWRRVHAANMRKMRSPASEESAARGSAFDVIKPPGFEPPVIRDLFA